MNFLGLLLDGFDHLGMAVTGGNDRDAGGKIQEAVAIHIPHLATPPVIHDQRITARVGGRDDSADRAR